MPLPDFDSTEVYLVHHVKAAKPYPNAYTTTYVVFGALLTGLGFYHDDRGLMLTAMLTVVGFKAYEQWYQAKLLPAWKSIFAKYEAAIAAADALAESAQNSE